MKSVTRSDFIDPALRYITPSPKVTKPVISTKRIFAPRFPIIVNEKRISVTREDYSPPTVTCDSPKTIEEQISYIEKNLIKPVKLKTDIKISFKENNKKLSQQLKYIDEKLIIPTIVEKVRKIALPKFSNIIRKSGDTTMSNSPLKNNVNKRKPRLVKKAINNKINPCTGNNLLDKLLSEKYK